MLSCFRPSIIRIGITVLIGTSAFGAEAPIDFRRDVWPILEKNCLDCHGSVEAESEFRVDLEKTLIGGGGSEIPSVVAGDPIDSYLIEVLRETDDEYRMPQDADPLHESQIALLEKWIEQGAVLPEDMEAATKPSGSDFWSLQPVVRHAPPEIEGAPTPIDAFLLDKLTERDLSYNPEADARSLIRRTAIILTGLPPTPEAIAKFSKAHAKNPKAAFGQLVDELLESPRFGERWAQHWLDVIRWAETHGSEANLYRKNAWMYRDYVVDSFNNDLPYNDFIREQLAGDQLGVGVATGFLVAGPHVPAATVGREESAIRQARADRLDEIAQTVGASMIGLTVSCARCHNHKFDPISIGDYYSLTSVFQGVEFGGRYAESDSSDPIQVRGRELEEEIDRKRDELRHTVGSWQEDWEGWGEFHFPEVEAQSIRITFDAKAISLDELELFGSADPDRNLALHSAGAIALSPEANTKSGGESTYINDGEYSTMMWKGQTSEEDASKPNITFKLPERSRINRLTLSSNRQYFFETDYLSVTKPHSLKKFTVEILNSAGEWVPVASTAGAMKTLKSKPENVAQAAQLKATIDRLLTEGPQPSFVGRFIEPAVGRIFHRGSPESPRDEVPPAGIEVLNGDLGLDSDTPEAERRLKFADWLADPEHPLTARVIVNRVWHHIFGAGIVTTPADFGVAGAPPSHPELLDWLAAEFVDPQSGEAEAWSIKDLIRSMLMTDAFVQSSAPKKVGLAQDASAMYLWRYPPRRIEAEVLRDGILQASGKLDPRVGGKSYRIHNVKKTYSQWEVLNNHGEETWRRLLYQERMRRVDDRNFTAFDFPDCGQVRAKRPVSTTPLQALNLMNSEFSVEQAGFIAERAAAEAGGGNREATERLFELVLGRKPDAEELRLCLEVVDEAGLQVVSRTLLNANEFAFLP